VSPILLSLFLSTALAHESHSASTPVKDVSAEESSELQPAPPPSPPMGPDGKPLPPPPESRRGAPGGGKGPPPAGELSPDRLKALRAYKNQSLSIRRETELQGGGARVGTSMAYGMGPVIMTQHVTTAPVYTVRTWGIYRGPERINMPRFLELVGDEAGHASLVEEIERKYKQAKTGFTVAGAGGVGLFMGIMGMSVATTESSWYTWNVVALGGSLTGLGGMVAGSLPASRATQLTRHPRTSTTPEEAQVLIDEHNEALRDRLGLSPKEVWLMEMGGS
jgi:hypothetical protein